MTAPNAFPTDGLIISAATTGSWPTKAQNPALPTTEAEIAEAAVSCGEAGAAIVHIHVRDDRERVTCDPARYAEARRLVEAAGSDVIINMSTGGGAGQTTDEAADRADRAGGRDRLLRLRLGQFRRARLRQLANLSAPTGDRDAGAWRPARNRVLRTGPRRERAAPDRRRHADAPLLVPIRPRRPRRLARHASSNCMHLVEMLPAGAHWSVCGIGRAQLPLGVAAMAMGGHVRTGLEDNLYYRKGELAASNAQLVARLARIAGEMGRPVATPARRRALARPRGRASPPDAAHSCLRVAAAQISHETNVFSAVPTDFAAFQASGLTNGRRDRRRQPRHEHRFRRIPRRGRRARL